MREINNYQMNKMPDTRRIIENINHCVISTDLNGTVTYWNKACKEIFGYSKNEMIDKPLKKIYPVVAEEQYHKDLSKLRRGQEVKGQWKSIAKDGSIIWIDVHAKPLFDENDNPKAVIASAHDIGKLKMIEKELEESKAQAQAILETTIDGIFTVDSDGKILSFNHSASRIFGYSKEEIVGKDVKILVPQAEENNYNNYLQQYNKRGQKHVIGYRRELTGRRKDGTKFPMELSVSKVAWKSCTMFTCVVNDISERRELEKEILRISEEERQNLGQDLHDVLGQMLTGIHLISKNVAQKLRNEGMSCSEDVEEISNLVKEADEYAKTLARGLVHINFEKDGLKAAFNQLAVQVEKLFDIECKVSCNGGINISNNMKIMHLYRIAQESISNAVKHGKAKNIDITLQAKNGTLKLSIEDDGIGFNNMSQKNNGLGIHIMRYRASILSGRIEIFETENQKTNIVCSIPLNP